MKRHLCLFALPLSLLATTALAQEGPPASEARPHHEAPPAAEDAQEAPASPEVVEAAPPEQSDTIQWGGFSETETVRLGDSITLDFSASSAETPLRFTVEEMPRGTKLTWNKAEFTRDSDHAIVRYYYPSFHFKATAGGEYVFEVSAANAHDQSSRKVKVSVVDEWESFVMPGLSYSVYLPNDDETLGMFHGPAFEFLWGAWIHHNENRGPSHGRIYSSVGLLSSTKSEMKKAVRFDFGFDLSIERNPVRRYLIPYFGIEGNVFVQSQVRDTFFVSPFGGVHLWSDQNTFVNVQYGYAFPTVQLDRLRGHSIKASVDFSLW